VIINWNGFLKCYIASVIILLVGLSLCRHCRRNGE